MNLREQVLRGGFFLSIRQALGFVLGVVSTILVTRTIGPAAYGLYAAALGVFLYLNQLSSWGITVYLIRKEGEAVEKLFHQGFSLLLVLGLGGSALALLGIPLLERLVKLQGFAAVALVFFLGLPLSLVGGVPMAFLERSMAFKQVAIIELANQSVYFLVAVFLAYGGFGVWAPVSGYWAAQLITLILLFRISGYAPKLVWDRQEILEMVRYGLGFSGSSWVWQLRTLVNPVLVARFLGAEAVGFVAVAIKLVNMASFVKNATWRLSIAALGHLQGSRQRLAQAIHEGMQLQMMALGPILVALLLIAPWLLPIIYGADWLPVLVILPYIALGSLANALFNIHASALYVLGRNWEMTKFHLIHVVLFFGSTLLLISKYGLIGYGLAELVAVPGYFFLYKYVSKEIGIINYKRPLIWFTCLAMPLFYYQLGWWTIIFLLFLLIWKETWLDIMMLRRHLQGSIRY